MFRYLQIMLVVCAVSGTTYAQDLTGSWRGQIEIPGSPLEIGLTFSGNKNAINALTGTIDIPVQGVRALPLANLQQSGRNISFELTAIQGEPKFEGKLSGEGVPRTLTGTFSQGGQRFSFALAPGQLERAVRPQEPTPPFPYRSEQLELKHGNITLAGTLTLPQGNGPFAAVQLITGSGAQDRDETIAGHKPFLLLADTLTRAGYAVLRFDDRGVAGSTGKLENATYDDLAGDILAGIDYLRHHQNVDPERIGLLGHSEGGYLAPLVVKRSPKVAFVILLAGPAVPGAEVLALQNRLIYERAGTPADQVRAQVSYIRNLAGLLERRDYAAARALSRQRIAAQYRALPAAQRPSPEAQEQAIAAQLSALNPNLRSFITYDPKAALAALELPVLALYGSKDLQVPASQNAPVMRARLGANTDATVRVFSGLNHLMQPARTGAVSEYAQIDTTISPVVLETIKTWLKRRF